MCSNSMSDRELVKLMSKTCLVGKLHAKTPEMIEDNFREQCCSETRPKIK